MRAHDFRRQKWVLVLRILGIGLGAGLAWSFWAAYALGEGYPKGYLLGPPDFRFSDYTDAVLDSALPNPYLDPIAIYPPAAFVLLRAVPFSDDFSLVCIDFFCLIALALLLYRVLPALVPDTWARVFMAFFFLALSYPLLYCIDRGNIDIVVFPAVGWAIYFYRRRRDLIGTACLFPVICLKLYPAIFLFLLLRRGKAGLAVSCGLGALAVNAACFCLYQDPPSALWNSYKANTSFYHDYYILDNNLIRGTASVWNTYKIVLILLHKNGLIPRINFGFDGAFIRASYQIYLFGFTLLSLLCLGYASCYERSLSRSALMLLLLITLSLPAEPDYRMAYLSMALVILVLQRGRRGDLAALILLALAALPKKEIYLNTLGTESQYDVSIQGLLNPIFILMAMAILLYHARPPFDWRQAALRLRDLFLPWRWRWA